VIISSFAIRIGSLFIFVSYDVVKLYWNFRVSWRG